MTESMINIVPFGGCGLHGPLGTLYAANREPVLFRDLLGYVRPPFGLSATSANQMMDFLDGRFDMPLWVRRLTFGDPMHIPTQAQVAHLRAAHVALIEMSTPIDYVYEGYYLNINRFEDTIFELLRELAIDKKLVSSWRSAIKNAAVKGVDDTRRQLANTIADQIPVDTEEQRNMAAFIRGTRAVIRTVDEMRGALGELREKLGLPFGMILHNYQFMPDGRALSWPASFKTDSAEIARDLGMPTYDFADFVLRQGVANIMADDRRHWNKAHYFPLGRMLYDFAAGIVGAPPFRLKSGATEDSAALGSFAETDVVIRATEMPTADEMRGVAAADKPLARTRIPRFLHDRATGAYMPADDRTLHGFYFLGTGWAMGVTADDGDIPERPRPAIPGKAWMFDRGLAPRQSTIRALVDLDPRGSGAVRESPAGGMADLIVRQCDARFGAAPDMFFATFARNGTSLTGFGQDEGRGLVRGSQLYSEMLYYTQRARDLAQARGQRFELTALCLLAGEHEVAQREDAHTFARDVSRLQQDLETDIMAITGQTEPVRMLVSQTNRATVALRAPDIHTAQLHLAAENPRIHCVGPVYHVAPETRPNGPAAYPDAAGYRRIGQQFGHFVVDCLWGRQAGPLQVVDSWWENDRIFALRYSAPLGIETDDSRVVVSTLGPGLGLDVIEGAGALCEIESVALSPSDPRTILVTLKAPPLRQRCRVFVAARRQDGFGIGRDGGPRSAIRAAVPYAIDPGTGEELYDWACTEIVVLR